MSKPKNPKVHNLIVATLKLGGWSEEKSNQAAGILSKYLRLK